MMKFLSVLVLCLGFYAGAPAQTQPGTVRSQVAGSVSAVDTASNQVTIKTDKGETVTLTINEKTQLLHAAPGEKDPKNWAKLPLAEVAPGDQALAYYRGPLEQKPLVATSLVIRTKADLSALAKKELDEWKSRGTGGIVVSVDSSSKSISLKAGQRTVTVSPNDKTVYRRYSADSAKPADARPGSFDEIKPGDQVNVLGTKSADGSTIEAETIYSGAFRQIAATVISIDAGAGEMKVTDLATKKPLAVRITSDSTMKKLPEPLAQGLARRYQGGPGREGGAAQGRGMGRGPGGGGDIGQVLDRLPQLQLSELKPKDAIMLSTTSGSDPNRVTAIMLLAGVEPLLTASPTATRDIMSGWNLGGGGGGEGGQ